MRKPEELKRSTNDKQLCLGSAFEVTISPKLRIKWVIKSTATGLPFIPLYKSAPADTVITRCHMERRNFSDKELDDFFPLNGKSCIVDAICQYPGSGFEVLTLVRWPKVIRNQTSLDF